MPYDEERKESLKNVKRKPCERVDCCLSNKLVGKMASCSPFLFVQTLLYKVTYVALSESACVCVHWIVMLCVHCINVTWNTFLCFKNIFLHFECVTILIVFWAPPQCKLFSLLPEWLQCRYRNRQILQLLLCRQGKSLHPYNLDVDCVRLKVFKHWTRKICVNILHIKNIFGTYLLLMQLFTTPAQFCWMNLQHLFFFQIKLDFFFLIILLNWSVQSGQQVDS